MRNKIIALILATAVTVLTMAACTINIDNLKRSDDIYSFQISIDGKIYTLPCKFSKFEDDGWVLTDIEETLVPYFYSWSQEIKKSNTEKDKAETLSVTFFNTSTSTKEYTDCSVATVYASSNGSADIVLPGGLTFDENLTEEDIIAQYGEPTEKDEDEDHVLLEYVKSKYQYISFSIYELNDSEDRKVSLTVCNFGEDVE